MRKEEIEVLYRTTKPYFTQIFESMVCNYRIEQLLPYTDIMDIHTIVNSIRYMGNAEKRVNLIDQIMRKRDFRKFHAGTNRTVYLFLDDPSFVAKTPIDHNGESDNLAEFNNQNYLKPFCAKMFQHSPQFGTISFSERVVPITTKEGFISIAGDVFELLYKLSGEFVMDDVGVHKFMNYGIRPGFGPVFLDYPKIFKLDGNKLQCTAYDKEGHICNADIGYDIGFNKLICSKCGRMYFAKDLGEALDNGLVTLIKPIMEGEDSMYTVVVKRGNNVISEKVYGDGSQDRVIDKNKKKTVKSENIKKNLKPVVEDKVIDNNDQINKEINDSASTIPDALKYLQNANKIKDDIEEELVAPDIIRRVDSESIYDE